MSEENETNEEETNETAVPAPEVIAEEKPQAKVTEAAPAAEEVPAKDADATDAEAKEAPAKKEETAEDLLKSDLEGVKIRRAKGSKNITVGVVNVLATFNNTKVTFADPRGNVISWSSAGKCNFRGSRKSTAYAAQVVTQDAGRTAMSHGMKEVVVKLNGPGMGRDSAVRALQSMGMIVTEIIDVTPVPHNGCRAPKRRRV
ncbi:MAG: 30S ribosomal protein S11 [Opitutia bacterium UBA7350]|nr:MAG: 30S ribosomal protein S11 [Opitutae bacterium UBA7350]